MQKLTEAQLLDDKVDRKNDFSVPGTVRSILFEDLNANAFKKNKKRKPKNISSVSGSNKETKKDDKENANTKANYQPVVSSTAMVTCWHGQGRGGCFGRGSTKYSGIFDLIVWIVHL